MKRILLVVFLVNIFMVFPVLYVMSKLVDSALDSASDIVEKRGVKERVK